MNAKLKEKLENNPFDAMMAQWMQNIDITKQVDGDGFAFMSTEGVKGVDFETKSFIPGDFFPNEIQQGTKFIHLFSPCIFKTNISTLTITRPYYYAYGYLYSWLTLHEEQQKNHPVYNEMKSELARIHPEAFRDLEYRLEIVRPFIREIKDKDERIELADKMNETLSQALDREQDNPDLDKAYSIMAAKYMNAMRNKNSKKRECVKDALTELKKVCKLEDIPEEILNSLDSYDDEDTKPAKIEYHITVGNGGTNICHADKIDNK